MSNNFKNVQVLEDLLGKYQFKKPVPINVQSYIAASKKKNLVNLLKQAGWYTPFFAGAVSIFLALKKIGFKASMAQATAVLVSGLIIAGGIISSSSYLIIKNLTKEEVALEVSEEDLISLKQKDDLIAEIKPKKLVTPINSETDKNVYPNKKEKEKKKDREEKKEIAGLKNVIFLNPLETVRVEPLIVKDLFHYLKKELSLLRGPKRVWVNNKDRADFFLLSSVEKIADDYLLSLKLVNRQSGEILFLVSRQAVSLVELKSICQKEIVALSKKVDQAGKSEN